MAQPAEQLAVLRGSAAGDAVPDPAHPDGQRAEFPLAFKLTIEEAGIEHRHIRPRRPQQNGKVERSHRIDNEEFWSRQAFTSPLDAELGLQAWERGYDHDRCRDGWARTASCI